MKKCHYDCYRPLDRNNTCTLLFGDTQVRLLGVLPGVAVLLTRWEASTMQQDQYKIGMYVDSLDLLRSYALLSHFPSFVQALSTDPLSKDQKVPRSDAPEHIFS